MPDNMSVVLFREMIRTGLAAASGTCCKLAAKLNDRILSGKQERSHSFTLAVGSGYKPWTQLNLARCVASLSFEIF